MKDAFGKDLKLGQQVAVPCNSKFKIGILYNYRPNNTASRRRILEYLANPGDNANDWRRRYYTQELADEMANIYYVRFPDGKTRRLMSPNSILGLETCQNETN